MLTTEFDFKGWSKIPRLNRDMIVTEKLDGSSGCVFIGEDGSIGAQSRKRIITPDDDNYGFAAWVEDNAAALVSSLKPGYHFGEYWGGGIQRNYGLAKDDKRFSLFNSAAYENIYDESDGLLYAVPVLYEGPFDSYVVDQVLDELAQGGSHAVPGFMDPEGVVVFHVASNKMFKATCRDDEAPKQTAWQLANPC